MPAATNVRLLDVTLTVESNGKASASAEWQAEYDVDSVGTYNAIALAQAWTTPLPTLGATYNLQGDTYNGLYLKRLTAKRGARGEHGIRLKKSFTITGEYSTPEPGQTGGDQTPDPLARPTKYWLEFETETRIIEKGYLLTSMANSGVAVNSSTPIINAVGNRFEDAVFDDQQQVYLMQQRNFSDIGSLHAIVQQYDRTVNKDAFLTFPKHCVKFAGIQCGPPIEENNTVYYTAVLRLAMRREPWYLEIVNTGTRAYFTGPSATPVEREIYEDDLDAEAEHVRISEPKNLHLDGYVIVGGGSTTIKYRTREEANYNLLLW